MTGCGEFRKIKIKKIPKKGGGLWESRSVLVFRNVQCLCECWGQSGWCMLCVRGLGFNCQCFQCSLFYYAIMIMNKSFHQKTASTCILISATRGAKPVPAWGRGSGSFLCPLWHHTGLPIKTGVLIGKWTKKKKWRLNLTHSFVDRSEI